MFFCFFIRENNERRNMSFFKKKNSPLSEKNNIDKILKIVQKFVCSSSSLFFFSLRFNYLLQFSLKVFKYQKQFLNRYSKSPEVFCNLCKKIKRTSYTGSSLTSEKYYDTYCANELVKPE